GVRRGALPGFVRSGRGECPLPPRGVLPASALRDEARLPAGSPGPEALRGGVRAGSGAGFRVSATRLAVKVVPGSSQDGIAGWLGDTLKVRVSAPAERGKANAAVEALLADALGVPRDCVRIGAGTASPRKVVEIAGLTEAEVRSRLG